MDIKKTYKLNNSDFLTKCFEMVNCMQTNKDKRLTEAEVKVITEFTALDETHKYDRFSLRGKKAVLASLASKGWSLKHHVLNIHISHLKQKGVIVEQSDKIKQLHPKLSEAFKNKKLTFTFELNNES